MTQTTTTEKSNLTIGDIAKAKKRQAIAIETTESTGETTTRALVGKLTTIEREMNGVFAEREREIRGLMIAVLAREHILLLGLPGTAKSAIGNTFCDSLLGATFFQWLLTRFTSPEELFGPPSLEGLKNDKFRRVTSGKLPEASVVFLDEIYKANSAVLNSLLTAINERAFDNDGGRTKIPLEIVIGASNELPESSDLAALHDRFMLRYWVTYTKTPDAFRRLITGKEPAISSKITLGEIAQIQREVENMPITESAIDELFKLRGEVDKLGIVASDRRWRKAARILQASAYLEGMTEVTPEAFPILANVLWETTEQIGKLRELVAKYTNAELAQAQEVADAMAEVMNNIPTDQKAESYGQALTSASRELKKALKVIDDLLAQCNGEQSKKRIAAIRAEIDGKHQSAKRAAAAALDL